MNLLSTTSTKIYLPKTDFGNLSSIIFFLNHLGFTTEILPINDLYLLQSEYILIPGNGNWCSYYHSGLVHYLKYNTTNRYIGICGGMQIMFASSEENPELRILPIFKPCSKAIGSYSESWLSRNCRKITLLC